MGLFTTRTLQQGSVVCAYEGLRVPFAIEEDRALRITNNYHILGRGVGSFINDLINPMESL